MDKPRVPTTPLATNNVYEWFKESKSKLVPVPNYAEPMGKKKVRSLALKCGLKSGWLYYQVDTFADVITCEYMIREIVQREQCLKNELQTFRKIGTGSHHNKEEEYTQELAKLPRLYSEAEYKLYQAETKIPVGRMRSGYDELRQDTTWYLRKELVEDCKKRGGCCSRSCGCCENRHERAVRVKGLGHCTTGCACCVSERGFDYTAQERQRFSDDLENRLYDDNPTFVIQMVDAFFFPSSEKPREEEHRLSNREQKSPGNMWKTLKRKAGLFGAGL
ncbi:unnamed protein product [Penicillium salamii]|nr:unnamed protein product [Penicillium salamii]